MKSMTVRDCMETMCSLQAEANTKMAGSDWLLNTDKYDYASAIRDEVVEAAVSAGWRPWWRGAGPDTELDINNLHLELVDIYHFHMSLLMQELATPEPSTESGTGSGPESGVDLPRIQKASAAHLAGVWEYGLGAPNVGKINLNTYLGTVLTQGAVSATWHLFRTMAQAGLDLSRLYRYYVAKNALNLFRTNLGYKQDRSVKYWEPNVEDNYYVMELARSNTPIHGSQDMYNKIGEKYTEITGKTVDF